MSSYTCVCSVSVPLGDCPRSSPLLDSEDVLASVSVPRTQGPGIVLLCFSETCAHVHVPPHHISAQTSGLRAMAHAGQGPGTFCSKATGTWQVVSVGATDPKAGDSSLRCEEDEVRGAWEDEEIAVLMGRRALSSSKECA